MAINKNLEFNTHEEKEDFVQGVFSNIAKHYDLMNTVLSFGRDRSWRKVAIEQLRCPPKGKILDVACGTAVLSIAALEFNPSFEVEGLDFNEDMLAIGRKRLEAAKLSSQIKLTQGDAMALPYADNSFNGAISAFALRNVPDVPTVIKEMARVVKPGGRVVTLELAKPTSPVFQKLYYTYFEHILPKIGKLSKDGSSYAWLPESLRRYPHQSTVLGYFEDAGLVNCKYIELTGGIVAVHVGEVPAS